MLVPLGENGHRGLSETLTSHGTKGFCDRRTVKIRLEMPESLVPRAFIASPATRIWNLLSLLQIVPS